MIDKLVRSLQKFIHLNEKIVFFDGDQVSIEDFYQFYKPAAGVRYYWVQNSKNRLVWKIASLTKDLTTVRPASCGKESVDTYIAMEISRLLSLGYRKMYIVSCDADFIDVITNASIMFTDAKFHLLVRNKSPERIQKHLKNKHQLRKNCYLQFYK